MKALNFFAKFFVASVILFVTANSFAASNCDLNSNFPTLACPFSDEEKKNVRFGFISSIFLTNNEQTLRIRFNSARYTVSPSAGWYGFQNCDEETVSDYDDLEDFLDELENEIDNYKGDGHDYIAFTVDPSSVREITKIWFINCEVESDRR